MKLSAALLTTAWAFTSLSNGAALPEVSPTDILAKLNVTLSPSEKVLNSLSYQFGYQLAGIGNAIDQLISSCDGLVASGDDKLSKLGLDLPIIQGPLCNITSASPNASYTRVNSIYYNTEIFKTQLLHSFNGTKQFNTLCTRLDMDLIDQFPIDGQRIKSAVCKASRKQLAPEPEADPLPGNPAAVRSARNTASVIYAILVAASTTTDLQLSTLCVEAPSYVNSLNHIQLNGTAVGEALCKMTVPVPATELRSMLQTWMTRYYITLLESISDYAEWLDWLCQNVDVERMNGLGLSGKAVQYRICTDAAAYDARKSKGSQDS